MTNVLPMPGSWSGVVKTSAACENGDFVAQRMRKEVGSYSRRVSTMSARRK
jgi:hypothetical protein